MLGEDFLLLSENQQHITLLVFVAKLLSAHGFEDQDRSATFCLKLVLQVSLVLTLLFKQNIQACAVKLI